MKRPRQQQRAGRRGFVFSVRITPDQRRELEARQLEGGGPRSIGAFMLWRALLPVSAAHRDAERFRVAEVLRDRDPGDPPGILPRTMDPPAIPEPAPQLALDLGSAVADDACDTGAVFMTGRGFYDSAPAVVPRRGRSVVPARAAKPLIILDLCAGSGSWSAPYEAAGYDVRRVTLPEHDVRTYVPTLRASERVHGILAAPPCDQFSLARNGHPELARDLVRGMECVNACLRIVLQCAPTWWALENPIGVLSRFLGSPADAFEPCDFGDPWTKRTGLWGRFEKPARGPFVPSLGGGPFCPICDPQRITHTWCSNPGHRAVTPAGFARAFFEANP